MVLAGVTTAVLLAGCGVVPPGGFTAPPVAPSQPPSTGAPAVPDATLRSAAPAGFLIGAVAPGGGHHLATTTPDPFTDDAVLREQLATEFSALTPENQLKWDFIHPDPTRYNFAPADEVVEFAVANGQSVRGHTLVWHSQNPDWIPVGEISDDELAAILKEHITTVVGRYAGRIAAWDVANEIFDENGEPRQENPWIARFGLDIVADAFRWAREADPAAALYLNDYGVEGPGPKSDAYYEYAQQLLADGVPLDGFGVQGHLSFDYPFPSGLQANLQRFADLGLKVAITELDVRMPAEPAPPAAELQAEQARWFADMVDACLAVAGCESVTLWGSTDRYSWVPAFFPDQGWATPWNDDFSRKPAYDAILERLAAGR